MPFLFGGFMQTLTVDLGERSYPIYIGPGLLANAELFRRHLAGQQVAIVTNETVAPLYLSSLQQALGGLQVATVILPDGESFKTWGNAAADLRWPAAGSP